MSDAHQASVGSSKKSKKRKKNAKSKAAAASTSNPTPAKTVAPLPSTVTEALEETLFWYNGGSEESSQNMAALKLEILGPFLFSRSVLCDEAVQMAKKNELLPKDSSVWPIFFDKSLWQTVDQVCSIMSAIVGLCDKEQPIYESLLVDKSLNSGLLARKLRKNSSADQLKDVTDEQLKHICNFIIIQGADYGRRAMEKPDLAVSFFRGLTDKVKLVDPVKDRGNSNFKQLRFKAAIADYSTAIRLCPFSPVLYSNRALCYLKNEDFWNACVDSYRALILHPTWEKPYYRCAEAWHRLGEISVAIGVNSRGRVLASSCADLNSQLNSFTNASGTVQKVKTSEPKTTGKATKEKPSTDTSSRAKVLSKTKAVSKPAEAVEFEELQCPELDPRISCAQLRELCGSVKFEWCNSASYLSVNSGWEELEPQWVQPAAPVTDPLADREPMMARFDEIWCPVLADVEESLSIIPPTFQYFSDGTIMHSAIC